MEQEKKPIQKTFLYKHRLFIGLVIFMAFVAFLTIVQINRIPSGLSGEEMNSVAAANDLSFNSGAVAIANSIVDLPYHLLQKASLKLFGFSNTFVRLPSIILAISSAFLLVIMLRKWFSTNIALISSALSVSSILFLTLARTGTPAIMMVFLTIVMLLAATQIIHSKKARTLWKIIGLAAIALGLYTPMSIYMFIVFAIAGYLHPAIRLELRKTKKWKLLIALISFIIFMTPLAFAIKINPSIIGMLFGFTNDFSISYSFQYVVQTVFGWHINDSIVTIYATPIISLALAVVILTGLVRAIQHVHSARSYLVLGWLLTLIPILIIHPSSTFMLFGIIALLTALGVETIITEWYKIFPFNPYARVFAAIPIAILMLGLAYTTTERYLSANTYEPHIVRAYSTEPNSVDNELTENSTILVGENEAGFYMLFEKENRAHVVTDIPNDYSRLIVTRAAYEQYRDKLPNKPDKITVDTLKDNGILLHIYDRKGDK